MQKNASSLVFARYTANSVKVDIEHGRMYNKILLMRIITVLYVNLKQIPC